MRRSAARPRGCGRSSRRGRCRGSCGAAPGERADLAQARAGLAATEVGFACAVARPDPDGRPLPRRVDVVGERDGEPGTAPPRRLDAEPAPQPLERGVEGVERRAGRAKPRVLVAPAVPLLDASEVEERLGELVALGELSPLDLLPRLRPVRNVVPEAELMGPDRVEDPASPFDRVRDQRNTPRAILAA